MMNENYRQFLVRLRSEVDRLCHDDPALPRRDAYHRAVSDVLMQDAESLEVTPFEARVLDFLDAHSPAHDDPPVPTKRLEIELNMNYFTAHYHLRKLEDRGLISRPAGPRSGWKVA